MRIIPVIDLRGGVVVHARRGERARYRPLVSPLAADATPLAVVAGLMALHPFSVLYVADLDAIAGAGDNGAAIAAIAARFPGLSLWLDAGFRAAPAARAWLAGRGDLVLGSEAQADGALLAALLGGASAARVILSLDFRAEGFIGPPVLRTPALWPARVIAMTLAQVGSGAGPDLARVAEIVGQAEGRAVFAAGGVRDGADLAVLRTAGAAGVLVASALHEGRVGPADLAAADGAG